MAAPAWLTARPIAHRGFHGQADGALENTLGAVESAIERDFAVEVDLRLTADGGLVVFHDGTLGRLTDRTDRVIDLPIDTLRTVDYRAGGEAIAGLDDLLALVSGRVPLLLELKSPGEHALAGRMVDALGRSLARYGGEVAAMSFDPDIVALLRARLPNVPRGIVAGDFGADTARRGTLTDRFLRRELLHVPRTRPDFVAYDHAGLPRPAVALQRRAGRPVLAWTVRSAAAMERVLPHADQIIFEDFVPATT